MSYVIMQGLGMLNMVILVVFCKRLKVPKMIPIIFQNCK